MTRFIVNPTTLPLWTDISIHTGPFANSTTRTTTDQGYDIDATRLSDARRAAVFARANGWICDGHFQYPLFLTDFDLATQLAGTNAQSAQTRDFYPRNFVQPNYSIQGQSLDQESYGKMCDFIRHIQYESIQSNLKPTSGTSGVALGTGLVQLTIAGRGIEPGRIGGPSVRIRSKMLGNTTRYNQMMKGQHQGLIILGYFNTMPRQHGKGQYSPTWTAQFIVVDMIEGPFQENMVTANKQATWVDLLHANQNISYTPTQAAAIAKADIAWINKNSQNIINTTPISGPNAPSGPISNINPTGNRGPIAQDAWDFSAYLAKGTGLDSGVILAWMASENGITAPNNGGDDGAAVPHVPENWLNIAINGPVYRGIDASIWGTVQSAATATNNFLHGQTVGGWAVGQIDWKGILATAGQSASAQMTAINNSNWVGPGVGYGSSIFTAYSAYAKYAPK